MPWCTDFVVVDEPYLLAVQTALIGLDRHELLAANGEAIGEGVVAGGKGCGERVDVFLRELIRPDSGC